MHVHVCLTLINKQNTILCSFSTPRGVSCYVYKYVHKSICYSLSNTLESETNRPRRICCCCFWTASFLQFR